MPWLERLFGQAEPHDPQVASADDSSYRPDPNTIPAERLELAEEHDKNGLAKRVALAFDEDPNIEDLETVYLAQQDKVIKLRGKVPSQEVLDELVKVAQQVKGVSQVQTDQVAIGFTLTTDENLQEDR